MGREKSRRSPRTRKDLRFGSGRNGVRSSRIVTYGHPSPPMLGECKGCVTVLQRLGPGANGAPSRSAHAPLVLGRPAIEGIGAAQALGEELHQLQGEVRILTHEEIELGRVDLDELRLF